MIMSRATILIARSTALASLLLLSSTSLAAQGPDPTERGRTLTRWLMDGRADSLSRVMSERFLAAVGGRDGLEAQGAQLRSRFGRELDVETEDVYERNGVVHYYRIARYAGADGRTVTAHWMWRDGGAVIGARIQPTPRPAPTEHADYRPRARLELPFDGEWYVAWGGRVPHRNYHVAAPDQRFAYDFLVARDGASHTGDGAQNRDYHCFGRPVLAPAAGRVVTAVDSVPDNSPGEMNRAVPPGNHVVIDHGGGEYSLLAHLRRGSVAVDVGGSVERGERVGECGNSGNSSEPHLHYHMQTGSAFGEGVGLPAPFTGYRADGEYVERGEPVRGQRIRPGRPGEPGVSSSKTPPTSTPTGSTSS